MEITLTTDTSIKRLLIANRGEIACRVIRTAKAMGIETIAVYSDADYLSLHVQLADQCFAIGPAPACESYLNIETLLAVAEKSKADAIHPGYGFLSENAEFAEQCRKKGICFVGPSPEAIAAMGSKSEAKELMEKAGVPMMPGYHGSEQSDQHLQKEAKKIGYPLLIKAAFGGGGKGMRVVHDEAGLSEELATARREAKKAFGNDQLLLERFITNARHIEIQVFFDHSGAGIYLFDRDCSLQRRHQKVIEEAPAPGLSDALRKTMGEAAVAAGKAINYLGAGTVEFLLDGENFYFMEMNTRLQVEHPVTEMVTGEDLVEWQLKVASGEPLPKGQDKLECHGHAIEARIYAEDPANHFLPDSGRILSLTWPETCGNLRIDTGVQQGDTISGCYDPMMAKMVAYGEKRQFAIKNLHKGLSSYLQAGVADNRDFLIHLLQEPDFHNASLTTRFIDQHPFQAVSLEKQRQLLVCAALYQFEQTASKDSIPVQDCARPIMLYYKELPALIRIKKNHQSFQITLSDGNCDGKIKWLNAENGLIGQLTLETFNIICRIIPLPGNKLKVFLPEVSGEIGLPGYNAGHSACNQPALAAPMNGTVSKVMVTAGEQVAEGSPLMIVEAMKMEHCILAPESGVISKVLFHPGDRVEAGTPLLRFQEKDSHVA